MTLTIRLLLTALIASTTTQASSSAFQATSILAETHRSPFTRDVQVVTPMSPMIPPTLRIRGGGEASTATTTRLAASVGDPAAKKKKIRIQSFDSMRFFLILNIVLSHFIMFAKPSTLILKFFSQGNVLVGAFFALSGYVTAYTTTENGQRAASPALLNTPKQKWILSKIFGYFPLHLVTLLLFSPVFLYSDVHYNGWLTAAFHGLLSVTMTQSWFPMHAEVWNAPTWFLSSLSFITALLPYCLPAIAALSTSQLIKTGWWVFMVSALPKIGYAYDFNMWKIAEGITSPKALPNLAMFNTHRFSPVFLVAEVLLGVIACRIVMLDGTEGKDKRKTNALSTAVPLAAMLGLLAARAKGILEINDLLFRSIVFVPLFLRFIMAAHRNTVGAVKDPLMSILNNKFLVALGGLSFPIFIVHGPVGQIFYKKLIANRLWGHVLAGPENFALYLGTTVATAWVLQKTFLENGAVKNWSKKTVDQLSSWM